MSVYYCTLAEAKDELLAELTVDDNKLMRSIWQVSRRIDKMMGGRSARPFFAPYAEARKFPLNMRHVNSQLNTLLLRNAPPLLSFSSVVADATNVTSVCEGYPSGDPWFRELRITSSGDWWYSYWEDDDDPVYATVTGVWGYHSDYANAWLQVDTLAAGVLANATSLTVGDVDGADGYGLTPRISRGSLLKIDSEIYLVTATNTTTNTVTATPHMLGTTAAAHLIAAPVYVYQFEEPIRRVTARQAGLMQARRGAFQEQTFDGVGVISYPPDLLAELRAVLQEYQNEL